MSTITLVGVQVQTLAAGRDYPLELWNTGGAGTIYASRTPGVTPTSADYTIPPSGHTSVPPGVTLYVCTDVNGTADGFWHADGTVFNPGIISSRAANAPIFLATQTLVLTNPVGNDQLILNPLTGLSNYQSLLVVIKVTQTGAGVAASAASYISLIVAQTDGVGIQQQYTPQWFIGVNGYPSNSIQVPVVADGANITLTVTKGVLGYGASGYSVIVYLYGSSENIDKPLYINGFGVGFLPFAGMVGFNQGGGVDSTFIIGSRNGPAQAVVSVTGGAGSCLLIVSAAESGNTIRIAEVNTNALPTANTLTYLPMRPLFFRLITPAATTADFALTQ